MDRKDGASKKGPFESRKGFGYAIRMAKARSSNVSTNDLTGNESFPETILEFIRNTRVGIIKDGVLNEGGSHCCFRLFFLFHFFSSFVSFPLSCLSFCLSLVA